MVDISDPKYPAVPYLNYETKKECIKAIGDIFGNYKQMFPIKGEEVIERGYLLYIQISKKWHLVVNKECQGYVKRRWDKRKTNSSD